MNSSDSYGDDKSRSPSRYILIRDDLNFVVNSSKRKKKEMKRQPLLRAESWWLNTTVPPRSNECSKCRVLIEEDQQTDSQPGWYFSDIKGYWNGSKDQEERWKEWAKCTPNLHSSQLVSSGAEKYPTTEQPVKLKW